jgi:hypothetical protein
VAAGAAKEKEAKSRFEGLKAGNNRCLHDPHPRTVDQKIRAPYPAEGALIYFQSRAEDHIGRRLA